MGTLVLKGLIHIVDDAKSFGPIDTYSCFPFENFLGYIKSMLRSKSKPLEQIVKRFSELEHFIPSEIIRGENEF